MRYLVLGYFGYRTNQLDGQTVKTRDIYKLLAAHLSEDVVDYFDTQDFQYDKLSFFKLLKKLLHTRYLFYLPAHNNLRYLFPVFFVLSKIFRFQILYFVVGGWLVEFLSNKPIHRWMLKHINGIFTETKLMHESLLGDYGFKNVTVFPNFRFTTHVPTEHHEDGKLKLVFLARINKLKGLDIVFSLASAIKEMKLDHNISIDFYGPLYEPDKLFFFEEVGKYDFVTYKGKLQPEQINKTIEKYDAMLLPTHYYTEGLPGSVLDAYMSGIPIIVSKWKHASEFVRTGETGFIIPFENGLNELIAYVKFLYDNPSALSIMKKNAYKESEKYYSEYAWNIILKHINIL